MDNRSVIDILRGVPYTFVSDQPNFLNFFQTLAQTLSQFTTGNDSLTTQLLFKTALGKSLDSFGGILGNPRASGESDTLYVGRLISDYNGPFGTPSAIQSFIQTLYSASVSVVATGTGGGYSIGFQSPLPDTTYQAIAEALNWIRPAGVPFFPFSVVGGGLYLTTVNYMGSPRITGAYLSSPSNLTFAFSLLPNTNNIISNYPVTIFEDPVLQGTVNIPRVLSATNPNAYLPPTAANGSVTGASPISGTLTATQPSGQTLVLTFAVIKAPANGTVTLTNPSQGSFTYTANAGFTGADSFTFTASNSVGISNTATESVTVTGSPPSPNTVTGNLYVLGTEVVTFQ